MKPAFLLAAAVLLAPIALAQQPTYQTNPPAPKLPATPQHQANFDSETQQANALFVAGKQLEALPFYEDLCRQDPTVALFAERHAAGLFAKASTPGLGLDPKEAGNAFVQGMAELQRAQSLGDNSQQLNVMLAWASKTPMGALLTGIPLTVGYTHEPNAAAATTYQQANAAFSAQKYDDAAKLFIASAAQDPQFYMAPLYAGDSYLRLKDFPNTYQSYAKAVAIDPDRETAYRYWGDALFKAGDPTAAKVQLEKAFVAEPYSSMTWNYLRQWAAATKSTITVPQIRRPSYMAPGGKLTIDAALTSETGDGHTAWLAYQQVRVAHGSPSVVQNLPPGGSTMANGEFVPNGYIHTLAEEVEALNAAIADLNKKIAAGNVTPDKLEPGLKILLQLQKDNMLECWILLNASDRGLRYDYPKYRAAHRDQLIAYVDRYILNQPLVSTPPAAGAH